ncbi:unnamed protein product [Symbiodinium sp. CCMP2592]|nr:unnamed protein product [Symbiodinium sp. CCMP2592]
MSHLGFQTLCSVPRHLAPLSRELSVLLPGVLAHAAPSVNTFAGIPATAIDPAWFSANPRDSTASLRRPVLFLTGGHPLLAFSLRSCLYRLGFFPSDLVGYFLRRLSDRGLASHRKLRRLRTKARTLLRTVVVGATSAFHPRVPTAIAALRGHHSLSHLPAQVEAIRQQAMSWQCQSCWQWAKASASYCPQCGTGKQSYVAKGKGYGDPWTHGQDNGAPERTWWEGKRPKSPRTRPPSPRQRGKGGGQGKQQGKGKGPKGPKGSKDKGAPPEATTAPGVASLPAAPEASALAMPKAGTSNAPGSGSADGQLLRAVLAHLATRDDVPAELSALMGQHADESHRAQGRALHKVVARQQEAKRALFRVRQERQGYEQAWSQYLGQLTQLLEKQLAERSEALSKYDASEAAWKEQLEEASTELSRHAAQPLGKEGMVEVQEISEDEMDTRDRQVDEAIAEEMQAQNRLQSEQTTQQAQKMMEALRQMQQGLPEKSGGQAREGSRTPRRSGSKERDAADGDGSGKQPGAHPAKEQPPGQVQSDFFPPVGSVSSEGARATSLGEGYEPEIVFPDAAVRMGVLPAGCSDVTVSAECSDLEAGAAKSLAGTLERSAGRARASIDPSAEVPSSGHPLHSQSQLVPPRVCTARCPGVSRIHRIRHFLPLQVCFPGDLKTHTSRSMNQWARSANHALGSCPNIAADARFKAGSLSNLGETSETPLSLSQPVRSPWTSTVMDQSYRARQQQHQADVCLTTSEVPPSVLYGCRHSHFGPSPISTEGWTADCVVSAPEAAPGAQAPRHFTALSLQLAARVSVSPPEHDRWEVRTQPLASFQWSGLARPQERTDALPLPGQYVLFDTEYHMRVRPLGPLWTIDHVVADILSLMPRTRAVRFLHRTLEGLPTLQVSATLRDARPGEEATPLDLRDMTGAICTCYLSPGLPQDGILAAYQQHCPSGHLPTSPFGVVGPSGEAISAVPLVPPGVDFVKARPRAEVEAAMRLMHLRGVARPPTSAVSATAQGDQLADDTTYTTPTTTGTRVSPGEPQEATPAQRLLRLAAAESADPFHQAGAGLYPSCVAFSPDFLRRPEVVHRPLADLCLFDSLQVSTGGLDFTVHAAGAEAIAMQAYPDWSLATFFHAATNAVPQLPQAVQLLLSGVPGLPEPQFVLTAAGANGIAFPVDFRFIGGPVVTVSAAQGDTIEQLLQHAPGLETSEAVQDLLLHRDLFLQDARGGIHTAVPENAAELQWLRVVNRAGIVGCTAMMPFGTPPLTSTSTTTTGMQGEATTVRLTLTGAGMTMTTAPVPLAQFDVVEELTTLILAITRAGRLPSDAHVVMAATWPLPRGGRHFNIPIVIYSPEEYQHIVLDPSVDGSQIHSMVVQAGTLPEYTLSRNQENLGLAAWVNGAPQSAVRRPLRTGDFVVPAFNTLAARASHAGANAEVRQALLTAMDRAEPLLRELGLFSDATRILDSRIEDLVAQVFILAPPEVRGMTYSVPNPILFGAHTLIHLPADTSPPWHLLPVQDGLTLIPPQTSSAASKPMSITTVQSSGGTSLAQLPDYRQAHQRRCRQAELKGLVRPGCPCINGQVQCAPEETAASSDPGHTTGSLGRVKRQVANLEANIAAAQFSIATPHGRRVIPAAPERTADNTLHPYADPGCNPLSCQGPVGRPSEPTFPCTATNEAPSGPEHKQPSSPAQSLLSSAPKDLAPPAPQRPVVPPLEAWEAAWHSTPDRAVKGPAARLLSQRHPPGQGCPEAIHIYVDGSAGPGMTPGWSVVVCEAYNQDGTCWENVLGFFSGTTAAFATKALAGTEHNMDGETVALAVASVWAAAWPQHARLIIFCDCQALTDIALGIAEPHMQTSTGRLQQACRCVWQALQRRPVPVDLQWLASHQGCPGNELADQVAKQARTLQARQLPLALFALLKHPQLPWLWHQLFPLPALPALDTLSAPQYEDPDPVPSSCFPRAQVHESKKQGPAHALLLCTYNVQSFAKRKDLCRTQFQHRGTAQVGSALPAITLNLGVRQTQVMADVPSGSQSSSPRAPCRQSKQSFSTKIQLVRLKAARLDCFLFSGHAPHSGAPASVADTWWHDTQVLLSKHVQPDVPLLVGIDANAQLGEIPCAAIGQHAPDPETPNGERLRSFCDSNCLALPATFASSGGAILRRDPAAYTWVAPNGGRHRIDYIAIPQPCLEAVEWHSVWHDFETGGPEDHYPVLLRMRLKADTTPDVECGFPRIGLRRVSDVSAAGLDLGPSLLQASHIPWDTNIHHHVAQLDSIMWKAADTPSPPKRPRKSYLDDEAWAVVLARKQAKRDIVRAAQDLRRTELSLLFRAWKRSYQTAAPLPLHCHKLERAHWRYYTALAAYRRLLPILRAAIEQSKAAYLGRLAQDFDNAAQENRARDLFFALRHFRPAGKKVFKPFGPAVTLHCKDGSAVQTHSQQQEIHRAHFAEQEAGDALDVEAYCKAPLAPAPIDHCSLADLPTLSAVERMIRQSKDGRAPGPSGVPGCMWKAAPTAAATALLPIYIKAHLRLTEPVQYRGCRLVAMLKKLSTNARAEHFRSIALLDPAAKFYHRLHRQTLVSEVQARELPLLQGCVPGGGPVALTHVLSTALNIAKLKKTSAAILFLDLRAAYYRLVREAVTGADITDAELCQLMHRLGVRPEHVHDVAAYAKAGGLIQHASTHFKRVLACTFHATYFVMDDVPTATATRVGSRPGDSISDILYGLAVADLSIDVRQQLADQGVPDAYMPTWADDISMPVLAPAAQLLDVANVAATTLHNACLRRAMSPNYDTGKTELLLAWHGEGARKGSTECYRTGKGHIQLHTAPPERLVCVTQYKHLGTTLRTTGGVRNDLRTKFAHAQAVVSPLMRSVFRRASVPLAQRATLLDTLAMTRATFGVAIWHHLTAQEQAVWSHGTAKLYRALHRPRIVEGEPHFPTDSLLCYQSGRPDPLHQRRLLILEHARFLGGQQLERLTELLQEEEALTPHSWIAEAQEAFDWLKTFVGQRMATQGVHGLTDFMDHSLHRPNQAKGWLRKARVLASRQAPIRHDTTPPTRTASKRDGDLHAVGCELCEEQFADLHTARAHMWAKHGSGTMLAQLAPSTRCPCCLTEFWRHSRLLRHLAHDKPDCGFHLLAMPPRFSNHGESAPAERRETLPTDTLPAVRVSGPLPQPQHAGVSAEQLCKMQFILEDGGPEAADFLHTAKRLVSEFACANTATRDALFAGLDRTEQDSFCRVLSNAGVLC